MSASVPWRPLGSTALAVAGLLVLATGALAQSPSPLPSAVTGPGCWTSEPGGVGSIDHPTEPREVVLRMSVGGGFVPREFAFLEAPTFTLYGNDVAIFRSGDDPTTIEEPLPPFACTALTPEQVDELLEFALDEGGLADARASYPNPNITDVPSTTFTMVAAGSEKTVVVQGLGFDEGAPDAEARAGFQALAELLSGFANEVGSSELYEPPAYRAMLTQAWPELEGTPMPWPWEAAPAELFGADLGEVATLTPEQVSQVTSVPSGGQAYILLETPDGERVSLTIRPLLPDEV